MMHQRIRIRIKEYTIQQKIRPRGCQVGSAEPGLVPVQVHFEEEWLLRHLITFHMCVGGKPTSRAINRPLLHPLNTHTHTHTHTLHSILSRKALLSLALLAR